MKKNKKTSDQQEIKWVFFILTALLVGIFCYKQDKDYFGKLFSKYKVEENKRSEKVFNLATEQQVEELQEKIQVLESEHDKRYQELKQANYDLKKQNILLGTIVNENFYIIKNRKNIYDILYLNFDWTIDRLPKYIQLPNQEEIQKMLKDNQ